LQGTVLITIILVVIAIFIFLRNIAATVIPSVTIPLALLGTLACMYLLNYSLDNLSLIALTIAIGFVVDDAIVMLENIFRHVEEGMMPLDAAVKGVGEIGFTIVSISLSLVAVFIPVLFMGGIVGRFLREFGVTVSLTVLMSMIVSLAFTPMLCGRFLRMPAEAGAMRAFSIFERGFQALRRWLGAVLRHQGLTLMGFLLTVGVSVYLYVVIPKGFFPQEDTGSLVGAAVAADSISYEEMEKKTGQIAEIVKNDPDVLTFTYNVHSSSFNTAYFFLNLRSFAEGRKVSADQVIARLRPRIAKLTGINLFLQSVQDVTIGARLASTQYQYTLTDPNLDEPCRN
jgi:HAE1 family hydrophobic/amphiphilic exporter-1